MQAPAKRMLLLSLVGGKNCQSVRDLIFFADHPRDY